MTRDDSEIRSFIAIELPEETKEFLKKISADLQSVRADVSWVKPHGMHLTLKFLGSVKRVLLSRIEQRVAPLFGRQRICEFQISKVGTFPNLLKPRVIWAGVNDESSVLAPLVSDLEDLLEPLGFAKEKRPFNPHLTLGRVRSSNRVKDLAEAIRQKTNLSGPKFIADSAVLFQSTLKPSGAEYNELARFRFGSDMKLPG